MDPQIELKFGEPTHHRFLPNWLTFFLETNTTDHIVDQYPQPDYSYSCSNEYELWF